MALPTITVDELLNPTPESLIDLALRCAAVSAAAEAGDREAIALMETIGAAVAPMVDLDRLAG